MTYYFDKDGAYTDRTGADGKFFDTFGNNQGYVDSEGRYYDGNRTFKGTRKEDGMFYDPSGRCLGYTDGKHWCFDPMGVFIESKRPKAEGEEGSSDEPKEKKGIGDTIKEILNR